MAKNIAKFLMFFIMYLYKLFYYVTGQYF